MGDKGDMAWAKALKRIGKDMKLLVAAGYPILREDGNTALEVDPTKWCTLLHGPPNTPYAGGTWRVRFTFSAEYPYKSPSIGIVERILHPNIDWGSGSVCLDAINSQWTPITYIIGVVELLLPGLLCIPNPADPLNHAAARQMHTDAAAYHARVRAAVREHAYNRETLRSAVKPAASDAGTTSDVDMVAGTRAGAGTGSLA